MCWPWGAGRLWRVIHIDWRRRRCYAEPADLPARSLWQGALPPESFELSQAQRSVLLGVTPDVEVSQRGVEGAGGASRGIQPPGLGIGHRRGAKGDELWWWTWADGRGNASLAAALDHVVDIGGQPENHRLLLRTEADPAELRAALDNMEGGELPPPVVAKEAVQGLKYRPGADRQLRARPQRRRPRSTGPCRAGHHRPAAE
jgi:ATP-dependent helicase Lhr and Lhr-like helicase